MKYLMRLLLIVMAAAMLLCAAGCVKNKEATKPTAGAGGETTAPIETTLPAVEGVEDWSGTPTPSAGQQTTEQPTAEQPTGSQEQPEQPTASDQLTLKEYNAMTTAQQQAYFESFSSPDAFYEWLEAAEAADKEQSNTVTGDGSLDLNDYIKNNG